MVDPELLEALRRVIYRWVNTSSFLTADAPVGSTTLTVDNTLRFQKGDEIVIRTGTKGEPGLKIDEVVDNFTLSLETPTQVDWPLSKNAWVQKTLYSRFVQGIYIGDPDVIPRFPAITIVPVSSSSEWLTLGTTKEHYTIKIGVYIEAATQEDGTRFILDMAKTIQHGLKKNIFPLVGDYDVTNVTFDVSATDEFIKVSDTSKMQNGSMLILENKYRSEELRVCSVVDSETVQVFPLVNNDYLVSDGAKIIVLRRFLFNSWPSDIDVGFISKGTLLKAATINWFADEQEVQTRGGWSDPLLS